MKSLLFALATTITMQATFHTTSDDYQLIIEPKWHNLESTTTQAQLFGGKWVVVGSITFKKRAKDEVKLEQLSIRWTGEEIEHLTGSLYRKNPDKEFMPLQENLVCDGCWNQTQQVLKLPFDHKQTLGPVNIFYLVLTIPENLEQTVKTGRFEIVQHALPEQFRLAMGSNRLALSIDIMDATIEEIV